MNPLKRPKPLPVLVRELREALGISRRQLADASGLHHAVVCRAERGEDAKLSTWLKLIEGLGYELHYDVVELCEEGEDLLKEEAERRRQRRIDGLCAGKRRYY